MKTSGCDTKCNNCVKGKKVKEADLYSAFI